MTRIASFAQHQAVINAVLQNQAKVGKDQQQLATGKKAQHFEDIASRSVTLLSSRSFLTRIRDQLNAIDNIDGRLQANDVQLQSVIDTSRDLQHSLRLAVGGDEAIAFDQLLEESFEFIVSALNTNFGGSFIFSGSKTDTAPVQIKTISDLLALPTSDDAFLNDQQRPRALVADNVDVEYGHLADEVASDLFASIRRLAEFDADPTTGPLDGKLNDAQEAFLSAEISNLEDAIQKVQSFQVKNGLIQNRVERIADQNREAEGFLETFISDTEDVNLAEAVTRLNNDQTVLQASLRTLGTLTQISLLDFI